MKILLRALLNTIYIYVCILLIWFSFFLVSVHAVDAEGAGFLISIYAPISTALILMIVYIFSFLDKVSLSPVFIGVAVVFTQLATLAGWSSQSIISEEYIFFAHLFALIVCFSGWSLFKKWRINASGR